MERPFAALFLACISSGLSVAWPVVKAVDRTFEIRIQGGSDSPVVVLLTTAAGEPAYRLECHTGDYEDESLINFSGTLQCAMFAVAGQKVLSGNLLAADSPPERGSDWMNRGRMLGRQLQGRCAAYPEYGAVRHFRFRTMVVTLRFSHLVWERQDSLRSFVLEVSVRADPTATSARAAALFLSFAALSACSRASTNASDYVGEYVFTPGQTAGDDCPSGADCADFVILRADGAAIEIKRSDSKPGVSVAETMWKVQNTIPGQPQIAIGDFACSVEISGRTIRLGIDGDLNEYYEKVR